MEKSWQQWVNENIENKCDLKEMVWMMVDAGFEFPVIKEMMGESFPKYISHNPMAKFDQAAGFERLIQASGSRKELHIDRSSPEGILVINDFIDAETCDMLKKYADSQTHTELGVVDFSRSDQYKIESMKDERRITSLIEIDGRAGEILSIFNDICCLKMAPFYDVDFEWYERPQLLRYPPGGRYDSHADADRWLEDEQKWVKAQDRDYSILLYLNDEYEGGEIQFAKQDYTVKPKPGMLITFPSDSRYMHGALPTTSGIRYALVSWATAVGTRRVRTAMPYGSVYVRQKRV